MVLLSDGADNAGGIDLDTISAIRRQRIPVHTIGFGREHPRAGRGDHRRRGAGARAAAIASSPRWSRFQSYGLSGSKTQAERARRRQGAGFAGSHAESRWRSRRPNRWCSTAATPGRRRWRSRVDPLPGEENVAQQPGDAAWSTWKRASRASFISKASRAGSSSSSAAPWTITRQHRNGDHAAHHPEQDLPPGHPDELEPHELEDGFPAKAEELFAYQGLIIGSVEANYFTATQQQLIRDFVDRRGGGLLFMGGRATLSDGGYPASPLADLVPTKLPEGKGTFHRDFTGQELTAAGRAERALPAGRRPRAQRSSAGRRCRSWPIIRKSAIPSPAPPCCWYPRPPGKRKPPLLVTENYGRGRTALFATEGSWRWKMWLDHADKTHATFWQQILRYLVTDTPGQVTATTPKPCWPTKPRVPLRVEVRDKQYKPVTNAKVQARFIGPDGTSRHCRADAAAARRGRLHGRMDGRKAGLVRGRDHRRPGAGRDWARRADVPPGRRRGGEFPHLAEPRTAGEALRARPAAVTTSPVKRPSWRTRSRTRKRASPRARRAIFGTCR